MSRLVLALLAVASLINTSAVLAAEELVVYSARKEHLVKPLFDAYTKETGTRIRYITDKAGPLLQRLKAEGKRTRADLLITVDAGNLWQAANNGVLAKLDSATLAKNVPAHLRDPGGHWYGLSMRARTIAYNPGKVKPGELSTYEDLASPKWKGRLCLRTSKKVYNQSLVATMIARHGEEKTEAIVRGWVANLATAPFSSDTKALQAVAAGRCDVTIVNTYYFGRLLKKSPKLPLKLFWPNQETSGVHVNISGAGVTRYAKHAKRAQDFLEWLSRPKAQAVFGSINMEYPVNVKVPMDARVKAWGEFKADQLNVAEAGRLQAAAIRLMDRAGYR